ncbi:MAG: M14 family zinc carboxypeptidase [Pseudomonadota bacterium]
MLRTLAAALLLSASTAALANDRYEPQSVDVLLDQGTTYDPAIPKPEDVTGYRLGEIIYPPDMHVDYIEALAEASDRVEVSVIGRSHFGRPIHRVTISSPDNLARLESIKATQRSLMNANAAPPPADHPVIMQFTYGVHGSEPSSYDAAPAMLYHLIAAQGPEIDKLLDEAVINIVVPLNPDGMNRFAQWTNMHHANVPVADPQSREHFYEWPWGRTNHYYFDLNRQKLLVNQPESRAVVEFTHEWMPNVAVDLHEMGSNSTFMFSPGPPDRRNPLFSDTTLAMKRDMNTFVTDRLDGEGALYVTEELFAMFYPGYGSSYPNLIGTVPYLFEQSSTRGLIRETEYGTLRYDDKIGMQARVGMAVIRAGHARRAELQAHMANFYNESRALAASNPVRGYVFGSSDRGRLAGFLDMLSVHNIEVRELNRTVSLDGKTYEAGEAFVALTNQSHYRLVETMFSSQVITERSLFYDVSAWTQSLAWDLDYAPLSGRSFSANLAGDLVQGFDAAAPTPERSPYVYVMEWDSFYAPRALYRLLDAGLRARVIPDETLVRTRTGEVEPGRGAIMVTIAGQDLDADEIYELMVRAAREDSVTIHAATSGLTSRGSDLGGFDLENVEKPEVLLATGRSVSSNDAGEYWYLLDHEMNMPVSMIDVRELPSMSMERYTHLILPGGDYSSFDEDFRERLDSWVKAGGILIASESGARWAAQHDISSAVFIDEDGDEEAADGEGEAPEEETTTDARPYDTILDWDAEVRITGALFETEADITHPLVFGLRDSMLPVTKIGTGAFAVSDNPFALPVRYAQGDPILAGYASEENREELAGTGMMHAERRGDGAVVLFADNPVFRAYMKGTARLVTNAIFFGNDFRNPARRAD